MYKKEMQGKTIKKLGVVEGEVVKTTDLVAFWGGMNWETGEIVEVGHEGYGKKVAGKILVCPAGKGGAGDTYGYFYMHKCGKAPLAIICNKAQGTTLAGALLAETPMVYGFGEDVLNAIDEGDQVIVDSDKGKVYVK